MTVEPPKSDPDKLLSRIESLIRTNSTNDDSQPKGKAKSWIWSLIIPVLALAGIAAFAWFSASKNRELAKLRHEKFRQRVKAEQAYAKALVDDNNELIAIEQRKYDVELKKIDDINADIRLENARYEANLSAVDNIASWSDAGISR